MNGKKVNVTPEDELTRQTGESYIVVNPETEFEMGHMRGMLVLGSVEDMDMENPANARAVLTAFEQSCDFLSVAIVKWRWLNRSGVELEFTPDDPSMYDGLPMVEISWLLEAASGVIKEGSVSEGIKGG